MRTGKVTMRGGVAVSADISRLSTRARNALNNAGVCVTAIHKAELRKEVQLGRLNLKKVRNLGVTTECEILEWLGIKTPRKQIWNFDPFAGKPIKR